MFSGVGVSVGVSGVGAGGVCGSGVGVGVGVDATVGTTVGLPTPASEGTEPPVAPEVVNTLSQLVAVFHSLSTETTLKWYVVV